MLIWRPDVICNLGVHVSRRHKPWWRQARKCQIPTRKRFRR